jgi:replication factor C subunit 1
LACEKAGFDKIEFNASDTRSKKALDQQVKDILNNTSMSGLQTRAKSKRLLAFIMDECDGMSAGDRGGVAELIQLIKKSKSPIICLCNDRSNPKIRNLINYCLDLKFRRPDVRQIVPRIKVIAEREGLSLGPNVIEELVTSTQGDIRQILNALSSHLLTQKQMTFDQSKAVAGKDLEQGAFDAIGTLLTSGYDRLKTLGDKLDLFFVDDGLIPLMIQV